MISLKQTTEARNEMTKSHKGILVSTIVSYLGEEVKKKNKKLAAENLHNQQEAFDAGDMFFKLSFMSDAEVNKIASQII